MDSVRVRQVSSMQAASESMGLPGCSGAWQRLATPSIVWHRLASLATPEEVRPRIAAEQHQTTDGAILEV
jgi:hypothetical protein